MAIHSENFVAVRKLYPIVSGRPKTRMEVADPATKEERDYRDLLSEANVNFFHREYTIALQNYQALRTKILVQSHPEMPKTPWLSTVLDIKFDAIDPKRLMELGRRVYIRTKPGDPVMAKLSDTRFIQASEGAANPAFSKISNIGLDTKTRSASEIRDVREAARDLVASNALDQAVKLYREAASQAADTGQFKLAAETYEEVVAMQAAYAKGPTRPQVIKAALDDLSRAEEIHTQLADTAALAVMKANRANLESELTGTRPTVNPRDLPATNITLAGGNAVAISSLVNTTAVTAATTGVTAAVAAPLLLIQLPQIQTTKPVLVSSTSGWMTAPQLLADHATALATRQAVLYAPDGGKALPLDTAGYQTAVNNIYATRVNAVTLEAIDFYEQVEVNFVSYFVHLYFFVLPIAIGDCYAAMGMYQKAIQEYQSVLSYPFLNVGIEAPYVWLKIANAYLNWGNTQFRRGLAADAKTKYEQIIMTGLTVPAASVLYQNAKFASLKTAAGEVIKDLKKQPHNAVNPKVSEVIVHAYTRLQYIASGFNFLGLAADYAPLFRFKYLQNIANYMADNAAQAERSFIQFRSTAENQTIEHMQLQNAVDVNQAALQIEQKRMEDADLEVEAATKTRQYSELRKQHADDALNEWNTDGVDLTSMNAALSWAGNAANDQDITYTNVRYDGKSHDYDGTVEDFFDTVGEKREWLNFEMQKSKLERQQAEAAAEVGIAQTREQQALVRRQIQELNIVLAQKRLEGSQQVLEYAQDRMFNEDLWFQLANQMQDLATFYLDAAIYSAYVMERAYELEFDRRLNRIRLDYGIGTSAEALLGGELLKRDIASFTIDYLEHAQKKNPVRVLLSLREEFPLEFNQFLRTGVLPFRTDLEIFDRRYPGTFRRKIKKVELFVEGLVPAEGAVGTLTNQGINAEWRLVGNAWQKFTRVMPVERMILSSYEFRRDISVFAPSDEMLGLFENMAPQCNWTIELPRGANNVDYDAISDIKFVLYFDADYSDSLVTHVNGLYPNTGGKSTVLSARFQFPDEYFRLDVDKRIRFTLNQSFFAYNYTGLKVSAFGVRLLPKSGGPLANAALSITRVSDNSTVSGVTDANGEWRGTPGTMAPFAAWKGGSPLDTFTVTLGNGVDSAAISDIQLFFSYTFTYRA